MVELEVLFHLIQFQADTTFILKYDGLENMTITLQHLHLSDLLTHDDMGADDMLLGQTTEDFTIGGSPELQQRIRGIF